MGVEKTWRPTSRNRTDPVPRSSLLLNVPVTSVFAWTDSSIVLSWLTGNPRRFKTYVGNRISFIVDQLPPDCWKHVPGVQNPADCASRGLFPLQLKDHHLWWKGPQWLLADPAQWPQQSTSLCETVPMEEREICNLVTVNSATLAEPVISTNRFSNFTFILVNGTHFSPLLSVFAPSFGPMIWSLQPKKTQWPFTPQT